MRAKGIALEFAERVFEQIRGFGEYGFPESHAASFALISYAGAWLRRHHVVEFTCGLLNSLPMGFYSAATILEDAKRHGVEFRPVDVARSAWDCTLEGSAIRMGLCFVKRLRLDDWKAIEAARSCAAFASLADFHRRVGLNAGAVEALSEAGAFESLGEERRSALWRGRGLARGEAGTLFDGEGERAPGFTPLTRFEEIGWDHASSHHSARGHPLAPLRAELRALRLPDARGVAALADGERVRFAGLVICRQRPGTASGITFMTLEDETGFVNLVVHQNVFQRYALLAKTQSFLGVSGRVQRQDDVVHVVVGALWAPKVRRQPTDVGSRDFH
jgi:error-prone DNA polymerase